MDSEILKLGTVGLTLALGWKGLDFMRWYIERNRPSPNGRPNGSAGAQSVDFWEKNTARIQKDAAIEAFTSVIAPVLNNQTVLFQEMRSSLGEMRSDLRGMRDKIVEIAARGQ